MALDIRGSLKNTRINKNIYICIDELFSNAVDSYLIRRNSEPSPPGLDVSFRLTFVKRDLFENDKYDVHVVCTDNGAGFCDAQVKAFITKDTSYKDDLAIDGIGECRGSGRIQFFHYFKRIEIDSMYSCTDGIRRRILSFIDGKNKEITEETFKTIVPSADNIRTSITLDSIRDAVFEKLFSARNLREDFSVDALKNHILITFLQRFVSIRDKLGDFRVAFETNYSDKRENAELHAKDIPHITNKKELSIYYRDDSDQQIPQRSELFTLSHYKLSKEKFKLRRNLIALCAKSSVVKSITHRYLKPRAVENNDINGYYHIVLVESQYLSSRVNAQRDDFEIPQESGQRNLFIQDSLSYEEIYEKIDDEIHRLMTPPDWSKDAILISAQKKYGISHQMLTESKTRIQFGDTEEKVAMRVLQSYQELIIKDTSELFDIQSEIQKADPNSKEFRDKINTLAWRYTSSLKKLDMTSLSQLVVRRAAMVEILDLAVKKDLAIQSREKISHSEKREDEKIIHNILFPKGKDSTQTNDHDIWLLNEEYQYFDYIASDKALSTIRWDDGSVLFDSDIDDRLKETVERSMAKTMQANDAKRPDIAIFSKEGAAIIIELKAPDVELADHTNDLMEYAQLLAAKSKGRLKRFYGYLLGTRVNPIRLRGYTRFPSNRGWFGAEGIIEPDTQARLGELYSEVLFYQDIVERAKKRLDVYRKRLGIEFSKP